MVVKNIKAKGLPSELQVLPHVESGYNPKARSKVGAVGMWQVMPGTAKMYGFDSKKLANPGYNTEVGLHVLLEKYKALKSWPLAITAYNHGLRGVQRAVEKTGSRDICQIIDRYDGPHFGVSSRNFYASFLAAVRVLKERKVL
jgi:membrane-bound lytic murein transglycosylase D